MRPFELLAKLLDLEETHVGLWVGFTDKGKPKAILPAGRLGEVCDASKMSKQDFDWLIKTHNERWNRKATKLHEEIEITLATLEQPKKSKKKK